MIFLTVENELSICWKQFEKLWFIFVYSIVHADGLAPVSGMISSDTVLVKFGYTSTICKLNRFGAGELYVVGQYDGCWCLGTLRRQAISSLGIGYIE